MCWFVENRKKGKQNLADVLQCSRTLFFPRNFSLFTNTEKTRKNIFRLQREKKISWMERIKSIRWLSISADIFSGTILLIIFKRLNKEKFKFRWSSYYKSLGPRSVKNIRAILRKNKKYIFLSYVIMPRYVFLKIQKKIGI